MINTSVTYWFIRSEGIDAWVCYRTGGNDSVSFQFGLVYFDGRASEIPKWCEEHGYEWNTCVRRIGFDPFGEEVNILTDATEGRR